MKNWFICFVASLSLVCVGCPGDDTDNDYDSAKECEENESECDGNTVVQCENGTWEDVEDCAAQDMVCVENSDTDAQCEHEITDDDGIVQFTLSPDELQDWIDSISTAIASWTSGLIDIAMFGSVGATVTADAAAQNATFVTANENAQLVTEDGDGTLEPGDYIIARMQLDDIVDGGSSDHRLIFSAVFDSDGDAANNWVPIDPWDWDFFQGADRWYQLMRSAGGSSWSLSCTQVDSSQATAAAPTDALALVYGSYITFLIPINEIPAAAPTYRLTAYGDDGAWSEDDRGGDVPDENPTLPMLTIPLQF
jgi:hypothetical protein